MKKNAAKCACRAAGEQVARAFLSRSSERRAACMAATRGADIYGRIEKTNQGVHGLL